MVQVKYKNLDNWRIIRSFGDHSFLFYSLLYFLYSLSYFLISIFSFYFKLIETFFSLPSFICFPLRIQFSLSKISPIIDNTLLLKAYKSISFKGHLDNKDVHFQKSPSAPPASLKPLWMCRSLLVWMCRCMADFPYGISRSGPTVITLYILKKNLKEKDIL